jgi:hypothetical protein
MFRFVTLYFVLLLVHFNKYDERFPRCTLVRSFKQQALQVSTLSLISGRLYKRPQFGFAALSAAVKSLPNLHFLFQKGAFLCFVPNCISRCAKSTLDDDLAADDGILFLPNTMSDIHSHIHRGSSVPDVFYKALHILILVLGDTVKPSPVSLCFR